MTAERIDKLWNDDIELFVMARREIFVAVVGDIMDKLRLFHQFFPREIQPLDRSMTVIGRALPAYRPGTRCRVS